MDVCKDLDEYTQVMQQHRRMLQEAKKRRGQRPDDRKKRDGMLYEFMMASIASMATAGKTGNEGQQLVNSSFVPPAYPPCTAALDTLKPIAIENLRLETHHRDTYLMLRAITPPNRMTALIVLAENENGDATILQLYQQENEASRPATEVVDKDSILLVKEPFFKVTASGDYSLRVDHLSDVVFLNNEDPRVPKSWQPSMLELRLEYMGSFRRSADSLKLGGCFGERRKLLAGH
jgi:hypothetical protein